jgi:hypothetical protein
MVDRKKNFIHGCLSLFVVFVFVEFSYIRPHRYFSPPYFFRHFFSFILIFAIMDFFFRFLG